MNNADAGVFHGMPTARATGLTPDHMEAVLAMAVKVILKLISDTTLYISLVILYRKYTGSPDGIRMTLTFTPRRCAREATMAVPRTKRSCERATA